MREIIIGRIVGKDIYNHLGRLVAVAGAVITEELYEAIEKDSEYLANLIVYSKAAPF